MKKIFLSLALTVSILLCGCSSEAEKANYNISKQADYFESERKITVYNARTDMTSMQPPVARWMKLPLPPWPHGRPGSSTG